MEDTVDVIESRRSIRKYEDEKIPQDTVDVIESRRSIRKYEDEKIPQEFILEILEAGRCAPSAF